MMLPNQITLQTFSQNGKGGYKAIEVDAFLQRVFQSYNKLYADNKALCEELDETRPLLNEYNQRKNSIADALIWAKSTAEKNIEEAKTVADNLVAEATEKAEKLYDDKKAEADAYYTEKTAEAEKRASKAQAEFDSLKKQSEEYSEKYIAEINLKAQTIVEDANLKAASIVSEAYADAQKAKEKVDSIIAEANAELERLKAEAAKIKSQILSLVSDAEKAADKIDDTVFESVTAEKADDGEAVTAEQLNIDDIEKFDFDIIEDVEIVEEPEEKAEENNGQPEFVRFFGNEMPDVNELLTGIFNAVSEEKTRRENNEDENTFRFSNIFAEPSDRTDTRIFDTLKKDSE